MSHFVEHCRGCGTQLSTCRCPAPDKPVRWGACARWPKCVERWASARTHAVTGETHIDELRRERDEAHATIARVEALCVDMDERWHSDSDIGEVTHAIRAALKGEAKP